MNCPRCEKPVRSFTVTNPDGTVTVLVDPHPGIGSFDRVDVFGAATESDPHAGGFVRHQCKE